MRRAGDGMAGFIRTLGDGLAGGIGPLAEAMAYIGGGVTDTIAGIAEILLGIFAALVTGGEAQQGGKESGLGGSGFSSKRLRYHDRLSSILPPWWQKATPN